MKEFLFLSMDDMKAASTDDLEKEYQFLLAKRRKLTRERDDIESLMIGIKEVLRQRSQKDHTSYEEDDYP